MAAGGASRRMGRDKALLPWGASTLLGHAVARLRDAVGEVVILGGAAARYEGHGAPALADLHPGQGPLGGLLTALAALGGREAVLLLGVDVPFATVPVLRQLVEAAHAGDDVVVPLTAEGPQPLCALYRATCLEPVRRSLERGDRRMTAFWPELSVRRLGREELLPQGDPELLFRNLNTPEEYAAHRA